MFQTPVLFVRRVITKPLVDTYWRRDQWMRFIFGNKKRENRLFKFGVVRVIKNFQKLKSATQLRAQYSKELFNERIEAACLEHGFGSTELFIPVLKRINIELDRNMLQLLAIYEPRTFHTLVELCKQYLLENADFEPHNTTPPCKVISRGMLNSPIVPGNRRFYI